MQLPFSIEQFFGVFRAYNTAVWPAQVLLLALALMAIALVVVRRSWSGLAISAILSFLWVWLGLAYHLAFFSAINPVAYVFAGVSVAGGLVFLWHGVVCRRLDFHWTSGVRSYAGLVFIVFSLIVYPVWSAFAGHGYPEFPTFGLPCPTTIFTIGLLAFAVEPYPRSSLGVPILWCFVGGQAAFLLDVPPDFGLVAAGLMGMGLLIRFQGIKKSD